MDELAIIEVNKVLGLCEAYLLTDAEITQLTKLGENPSSTCGYYSTAQIVLTTRAKFDTSVNDQLGALVVWASLDSCPIELAPEVVPEVDIPFYAGALI